MTELITTESERCATEECNMALAAAASRQSGDCSVLDRSGLDMLAPPGAYMAPPLRRLPIKTGDDQLDFSKMTCGDRVAYMRKIRDITQQQLASLAGLTQAAVSNLEMNLLTPGNKDGYKFLRQPRSTTLTEIARALDVCPQWLLHGVGPIKEDESHTGNGANEERARAVFAKLNPLMQREAIRFMEFISKKSNG